MKDRIQALVQRVDQITADYFKKMNWIQPVPTHRADYISDKWARIVVLEERNGTPQVSSVYCFVCLQDGYTKTLGPLKAGDIHKAASFKAPAKHARGSVLDENFNNCLGPLGVAYLR
jgi:hypothetical protein